MVNASLRLQEPESPQWVLFSLLSEGPLHPHTSKQHLLCSPHSPTRSQHSVHTGVLRLCPREDQYDVFRQQLHTTRNTAHTLDVPSGQVFGSWLLCLHSSFLGMRTLGDSSDGPAGHVGDPAWLSPADGRDLSL